MKILVINCGSSSLKYQLMNPQTHEVYASGICERIGIDGLLTYQRPGQPKIKADHAMPNHSSAIDAVIEALTDTDTGVVASLTEITAVGHRVVHGGEKMTQSVIITDAVKKIIEDCNDLAPLHNPANLIGIDACEQLLPHAPQVAVFDTAFHQTMPKHAYLYGLPLKYYHDHKIRRYGFHGTSHRFVSERTAELLGRKPADLKTIVCHLGNGASITAIKHGKSIDTSMGLTPLEGLAMGTRSGDIDPAIIEFICAKEGLTVSEATTMLNKRSGIYGLSGEVSSDFRDMWDAADNGDADARTALEVYCYRVAKYIGSYVAAMNGVDAIAFTAGVGENDIPVREMICTYLGYLGIEIDADENNHKSRESVISTPESRVTVLVVPTNEELAIARETMELVA
ncbi:MAG: acetate kinase [Cellulomonadaceae bacterium]|jgi:acetate kinase|nr:acetate kinase [Cellulomonadaceae bacterium]